MINEDSCATHRDSSASDPLLWCPKPGLPLFLPLITDISVDMEHFSNSSENEGMDQIIVRFKTGRFPEIGSRNGINLTKAVNQKGP